MVCLFCFLLLLRRVQSLNDEKALLPWVALKTISTLNFFRPLIGRTVGDIGCFPVFTWRLRVTRDEIPKRDIRGRI